MLKYSYKFGQGSSAGLSCLFLLEVIGMKKPLIGVVPLWDSEKNCYWMLPNYMQGIEKSGGIPVMLPLTEDVTDFFLQADRMLTQKFITK